jgi:hypothetical protein
VTVNQAKVRIDAKTHVIEIYATSHKDGSTYSATLVPEGNSARVVAFAETYNIPGDVQDEMLVAAEQAWMAFHDTNLKYFGCNRMYQSLCTTTFIEDDVLCVRVGSSLRKEDSVIFAAGSEIKTPNDFIELQRSNNFDARRIETYRAAAFAVWGDFLNKNFLGADANSPRVGKVTGRLQAAAPNQANTPRSLEPVVHTTINKRKADCYWSVLVETSLHGTEFIVHPDGLVAGDTTILDAANPGTVLMICLDAAAVCWQRFIRTVQLQFLGRKAYFPWEEEMIKYDVDPAEKPCPRVEHHNGTDAVTLALGMSLDGLLQKGRDATMHYSHTYYLGVLEEIGIKAPINLVRTTARDLEQRIDHEGCAAIPAEVVSDIYVMMRNCGLDFYGDHIAG